MYSVLTQSETFSWSNLITSAVEKPEVKACVRQAKDQECQLYPCEERNREAEEVAAPTPYFGYAGNFVHRDGNITKPLPASEYIATLLFQ